MGHLVLLGLSRAALGGLAAWALIQMQSAPTGFSPRLGLAVAVLVLAALAVGSLIVHERVIAERLGQDYVHHLRLRLLADALEPGHETSLGVTVARTTNDLTGVRTWISQGIAPLLVAIPLILGSLVTLAVLHPLLAAALTLPLAGLSLCLALLARPALERTRALRRSRGRMAARLAETVTAADAVHAAGGAHREVRNLRKVSRGLVDQAVHRAETVGALRAAGTVAATGTTLLVAAASTALGLGAGVTTAAMAVAGLAAMPVLELGRILEFRQNYQAARIVLGPALASAQERREDEQRRRAEAADAPTPDSPDHSGSSNLPGSPGAEPLDGSGIPALGPVFIDLPGHTPQPLRAEPGERIHLCSDDPGAPRALLRRILQLDAAPENTGAAERVIVAGHELRALAPREVRHLVGLAAAGTVFERGSVGRALRYRRPDLTGPHDRELLQRLALDEPHLPRGADTPLRRGGAALDRSARARLALGRALYGQPPLLLVEDLENDCDAVGHYLLREELRTYPGVVLFSGSAELAGAIGAREVWLPGGALAARVA